MMTFQAMQDGMGAIHPGEILREEFLLPLNLSATALAIKLQVPPARMTEILREKRAITVDTALRLSRYFGTSAAFWLGLQMDYDLAVAETEKYEAIKPRVLDTV